MTGILLELKYKIFFVNSLILLENDESMRNCLINLSVCLVVCGRPSYELNRFYKEASTVFQNYTYKTYVA